MANSTSANLKLTVQATGENSGTWGQITNTNLLILEQAIGGFTTFNLTNANRSLTFSNGALSDGKNDVIKLTGTLAANRTVSIPDSIEKVYHVQNACDHAGNTLTFKTSSGTGVLLCEGNNYVLYSDGTNIVKLSEQKKLESSFSGGNSSSWCSTFSKYKWWRSNNYATRIAKHGR